MRRPREGGAVSLSSWDDFPVHQAPEFIAHPVRAIATSTTATTSTCMPSSGEWFAIFGFGQYPNLGVVDAFIDVRRGEEQHIVRASAPLTDRGDLSVGPFRIEVLEPLRGSGGGRAHRAQRGHGRDLGRPHPRRRRTPPVPAEQGKVIFDTQRLAQTGPWSGTLSVDGKTHHHARAPLGLPGSLLGHPAGGRAEGRRHPAGEFVLERDVELLPDAVRGPRHHVHLP